MEKLRRKCETLDKEVQDSTSFKDFYLFTFNFAKNPGQKSLGKCHFTSNSGTWILSNRT